MSQPFKVSFESPQCGWMSVSLEARGARLVTSVAHAPYDSLGDLLDALVALLEGRESVIVRWNREPEEMDFRFDTHDGLVALDITRYADHRRASGEIVFNARLPKEEVCDAFWRELRGLRRRRETDEYEQNWRRQFPDEKLRRFTKALRAFKKNSPPR